MDVSNCISCIHKLHRLCTLHLKTRYHAFKGSYDNGWHYFIKTMLTINLQGSAKGYFISSLVSWQRFDVKYIVSVSIVNGLDLNLGSLKDMFYFESLIQTSNLLYVLIVS